MAGGSSSTNAAQKTRSAAKESAEKHDSSRENGTGMICVDFHPPMQPGPVGQDTATAGPSQDAGQTLLAAQTQMAMQQQQFMAMMAAMSKKFTSKRKRKSHDMSSSEDSQSEAEDADSEDEESPLAQADDEDEDPLDKLSEYISVYLTIIFSNGDACILFNCSCLA